MNELLWYTAIITLTDAYLYGFCKEFMMERILFAMPVDDSEYAEQHCRAEKALNEDDPAYRLGMFSHEFSYRIFCSMEDTLRWIMKPIWHYRTLQKIIEIGGLAFLFFTGNTWIVLGALWGHLWKVYDMNYYAVLDQLDIPRNLQEKSPGQDGTPFWLQHWFTFAGWVLRPYSWKKFQLCYWIGILGMLVSCYLQHYFGGFSIW